MAELAVPARSASGADTSMEEGPQGGYGRGIQQWGRDRKARERRDTDSAAVSGDRTTEGGAGFLGGGVRSMSMERLAGDGGPETSHIVHSAAMQSC